MKEITPNTQENLRKVEIIENKFFDRCDEGHEIIHQVVKFKLNDVEFKLKVIAECDESTTEIYTFEGLKVIFRNAVDTGKNYKEEFSIANFNRYGEDDSWDKNLPLEYINVTALKKCALAKYQHIYDTAKAGVEKWEKVGNNKKKLEKAKKQLSEAEIFINKINTILS